MCGGKRKGVGSKFLSQLDSSSGALAAFNAVMFLDSNVADTAGEDIAR